MSSYTLHLLYLVLIFGTIDAQLSESEDEQSIEQLLQGIPQELADGARGTGFWLEGIKHISVPKKDSIRSAAAQFLANYKIALLNNNEDTILKFPELVEKYGYPCEEYVVRTDDGYLLTLFRIPYGRQSPLKKGVERPVVFLMHGLIDSADDWIITGPGKALGYKMADAGYDVWFGNARGNTYSRKHVARVPSTLSFWEFSWEEIGRFDLPAMIDFALAKTGQKSLSYIGHSQGTTSFFVMCSLRPEYNEKIKVMFAMSPIAYMHNMLSPLVRLLSRVSKAADWIFSAMGLGEFLPNNQILTVIGGLICREKAITQDICTNSLFVICGYDVEQMNATLLPVIVGHSPAGSSVKQFIHYAQSFNSQDFLRFDYGEKENLERYGTTTPPAYDLPRVTAPVYLFYSKNDWLSHPQDVTALSRKLSNVVDMILVPNSNFNHMDYVWAKDADKLLYNRIFELMKKF